MRRSGSYRCRRRRCRAFRTRAPRSPSGSHAYRSPKLTLPARRRTAGAGRTHPYGERGSSLHLRVLVRMTEWDIQAHHHSSRAAVLVVHRHAGEVDPAADTAGEVRPQPPRSAGRQCRQDDPGRGLANRQMARRCTTRLRSSGEASTLDSDVLRPAAEKWVGRMGEHPPPCQPQWSSLEVAAIRSDLGVVCNDLGRCDPAPTTTAP